METIEKLLRSELEEELEAWRYIYLPVIKLVLCQDLVQIKMRSSAC